MDTETRGESSSAPPRHWAWISGWGIAPKDFEAVAKQCWPEDRHSVFAPTATSVPDAIDAQPDILVGYSLGSLLLLASDPLPLNITIVSIAPILAFDLEAGLGGKTAARTRVAMQTKFTQNPLAGVKLYLRMVELGDLAGPSLPYSTEDLAWGLEVLGSLLARPENIKRTRCFVGAEDPLVDSQKLITHCPQLKIIASCGHDFRHLLPNLLTGCRPNST